MWNESYQHFSTVYIYKTVDGSRDTNIICVKLKSTKAELKQPVKLVEKNMLACFVMIESKHSKHSIEGFKFLLFHLRSFQLKLLAREDRKKADNSIVD